MFKVEASSFSSFDWRLCHQMLNLDSGQTKGGDFMDDHSERDGESLWLCFVKETINLKVDACVLIQSEDFIHQHLSAFPSVCFEVHNQRVFLPTDCHVSGSQSHILYAVGKGCF